MSPVETIGYIGRVLSHYDSEGLGPFIMQSLLILLGPALFAASIYMTLGRIIRALQAESLAVVPVAWQTRLFVIGDVLSFLLQMVGGGIQAAGTLDLLHLGEKIITAGLFVQIAFFGLFTVTSVVVNWRLRRHQTEKVIRNDIPWQRMLYMLYTVSALILIRSVFRVVEYIQGNAGYLLRNEIWLYIFDAVLMAVVMLVFLLYHPALLLTKPPHQSLLLRSRDEGDGPTP